MKLNFRLKSYVSRQYIFTVRWGNGYTCTTTLLLEVFTQRNFLEDFIRLKLNFKKTKNRFLSHPKDLHNYCSLISIMLHRMHYANEAAIVVQDL